MTSIKQCEASLSGLSVEEVGMCLKTEASASVHIKVSIQTEHCKKDIEKTDSKASFSSRFNDRYGTFSHIFCHLLDSKLWFTKY